MKRKIGMTKYSAIVAGIFLGMLAVAAFPRSAMAGNASGLVTQIEYNAGATNPQLMIQLNSVGSVNYTTQLPTPGCGILANTIDTVKILHSQAQAALLAGKNVIIYYTLCGSINYAYDIVLQH